MSHSPRILEHHLGCCFVSKFANGNDVLATPDARGSLMDARWAATLTIWVGLRPAIEVMISGSARLWCVRRPIIRFSGASEPAWQIRARRARGTQTTRGVFRTACVQCDRECARNRRWRIIDVRAERLTVRANGCRRRVRCSRAGARCLATWARVTPAFARSRLRSRPDARWVKPGEGDQIAPTRPPWVATLPTSRSSWRLSVADARIWVEALLLC